MSHSYWHSVTRICLYLGPSIYQHPLFNLELGKHLRKTKHNLQGRIYLFSVNAGSINLLIYLHKTSSSWVSMKLGFKILSFGRSQNRTPQLFWSVVLGCFFKAPSQRLHGLWVEEVGLPHTSSQLRVENNVRRWSKNFIFENTRCAFLRLQKLE